MEDNVKLIESLLESAAEYGKSSYELLRLKSLDKTSDVVSSLIPHSVFFILILLFLVFLNFGLAFWLGEILGRTFYGFFVVAAFYGILGLILHFFMHRRLKNMICNYIVKQFIK